MTDSIARRVIASRLRRTAENFSEEELIDVICELYGAQIIKELIKGERYADWIRQD